MVFVVDGTVAWGRALPVYGDAVGLAEVRLAGILLRENAGEEDVFDRIPGVGDAG